MFFTKKLEDQPDPPPQFRAREMLPGLAPVAPGHIVEPQRGPRMLGLRDQRLGTLALDRLYLLGFAPRRLFCRAVKPMTSQLEVEVPERRAAVPVLIDGHGVTFRVWLAMNWLMSESVNLGRLRFLPRPTST